MRQQRLQTAPDAMRKLRAPDLRAKVVAECDFRGGGMVDGREADGVGMRDPGAAFGGGEEVADGPD